MAVSSGDVVVEASADVCCVVDEDENEGVEDRVLLLVVLLLLDELLLEVLLPEMLMLDMRLLDVLMLDMRLLDVLVLNVLLLVIPSCDNVFCIADETLKGPSVEAAIAAGSVVGGLAEVEIERVSKANAVLLVVAALDATIIVGVVKDAT